MWFARRSQKALMMLVCLYTLLRQAALLSEREKLLASQGPTSGIGFRCEVDMSPLFLSVPVFIAGEFWKKPLKNAAT